MRSVFLLLFFFMMCCRCIAASNHMIPPVYASKKTHHTFTHAQQTIITQQDMSTIGATSVTQALQELGGVQLQDVTGNGSQVSLSMRGFGTNASSNTLLLVNGIPITNPDLAPPDLNIIPLQEIESIEIIAGSESVLYGDQAVGGVINITTRQQAAEKFNASCAAGSYNQKNCFVTFNHQFKKLYSAVNIAKNHTDNYRDHNDYDQNHLSGRFNYDYQTGNLALDYQVANERMQYPGPLTLAQISQNRRQASNDIDFFKNWNDSFHIKNKQKIGSIWLLETDIAHRKMNGNGVLMSQFKQSREINYFRPQLKGAFGRVLFDTGMDVESDQYHLTSLFGVTNDTQHKYGVFAAANMPINSALSFSLGARGAQQNNSLLQLTNSTNSLNRALATTIGAAWRFNSAVQFYLRRAESYRFPKADENASTLIGVEGLKTQRGAAYETGMKWTGDKSLMQISLFQLNLRDEITFDPTQTAEQPFGANRNFDPTVRRGFSVSEKYQLFSRLAVDGQYNYVSARFQSGPNAGNRIPLVSENIFHGGANFKITQNWNLYSEAIYTGNQYAANDDANTARKVSGYTFYNVNLRYQFQHFSAAFRVNNLFNKYYYFYAAVQPGMPDEFFYPAPDRNFILTLKYVFT